MLDPQFHRIPLVQLFSCNDWLCNPGNSCKPFSIEWGANRVDKSNSELDEFKSQFLLCLFWNIHEPALRNHYIKHDLHPIHSEH